MAVLGEVQFAPITGASGDITLVAAQGVGVKIRVLGFAIAPAASAVVTFQSGTGGTALTGAMTLAAPLWIETADFGVFETAANALLNLHQTGVVQISGWLLWCTAQ
jgi:hypothetical protein